MQDDKTTSSDATTKHRNPPRDLTIVAANLSAESPSGSQKRLLRLSEKMGMSKHRQRNNALSPGSASPKKDDKQKSAELNTSSDNGVEGDEQDVAGNSAPNAGDTPTKVEEHAMDRIESQRAEHNTESEQFLSHSGLLPNVPEEGGHPAASTSPSKTYSPNRHRTPGGAAAKLMFMGPQKSFGEETPPMVKPSFDSSTASDRYAELQLALHRARDQVKSQFNMVQSNTVDSPDDEKEDTVDLMEYRAKLVQETPNLFDRNEIFFKTAEQATQALLAPRGFLTASDAQSTYSLGAALSTDGASVAASVASAFIVSDENGPSNYESISRKDYGEELLPPRAQMLVESLPDEMQDPNPTLAHLLQTIGTAPEGDVPDLGTTVRRKNACGALHVLTMQPTNRIPLVWTTGVLAALTSVLADTGTEGTIITYPDKRHRLEFETARDRAIACLVSLVTPKENRIPILHTPDLVHWLVVMILEGRGLSRKGACAILAYLAKTPDNRLLMVQVPRLVESLTKVLKRRPPRMEQQPAPRKATADSSDDEAEEGEETDKVEEPEVSQPDAPRNRTKLSEPSKLTSVSSTYSNQSAATQRLAGSRPPIELRGYDETADKLLREARKCTFATLSNLVKEKDNAFHFARDAALVKVMSDIALCHESPAHEHAVKFLACLTRHRLNSKVLVFRRRSVLPALVEATASANDSVRLHACYALQNLSQDKSCRQELAISENLLICLCERARGAADKVDERLAALSALKNLTDEPANLIPMSNTTDCIATLMHLAHGRQEGVTPMMQYRACDALATLSHWLRKIATSGQALNNAKIGKVSNSKELFVPSLRVVTVNQWQ